MCKGGCDKKKPCESCKKHGYKKIAFHFSKSDPNFNRDQLTVRENPFIDHVFINTTIYNKHNEQIGYKVADDYVQQANDGKYLVRINNTYYFTGLGTVSWQYCFENNTSSEAYPVGKLASSQIICGTGYFENAKGYVTLLPKADGNRLVTVYFKK